MNLETTRINLISGPRNISTALMYSFANRADTEVVDEPMYAYYLKHTGVDYHPGTEEILAALPQNMETVKEKYIFNALDMSVYFIKGMAHHYVDVDLGFLTKLRNLFLIRDPYQLIASFAQVIDQPTMKDIGLKREWELCQYLMSQGKNPIVIDSNETLANPKQTLTELCAKLGIPFSNKMLSWKKDPFLKMVVGPNIGIKMSGIAQGLKNSLLVVEYFLSDYKACIKSVWFIMTF